MKFTLSWLKEFLETNASVSEISEKLTSLGLEVEEVIDRASVLRPFTVAEILEAEQHPNADKLRVCKVNDGSQVLQIVCGASNARAGIKIPLAQVGVVIPTNGLVIKKSKIRDVESNGMLCSAEELGLAEESEGILELPANAVVGEPFASFIGADDPLFEIAITPNRGDCLGVYGIARDLAAAGLGTLKKPEFKAFNGAYDSPIKVSIEANAACKYFVGVYVKDVKNAESPEWLKTALTSIGQKSISALVDITNYLTFSFGRPAHIYDADKLQGNISVRFAKDGEKFVALNDKEYELDSKDLVIADEKTVLGLAGIIGGKDSGCSFETKNAFVEIAWFDPVTISHSGRKFQIDSDARYRFERLVDQQTFEHCKTAVNLLTKLCGGSPSKEVIAGSTESEVVVVKFSTDSFAKKIGYELGADAQVKILNALGFNAKVSGAEISVTVPSFRPDITIVEDVLEEIARVNGYDNIPAVFLKRNTTNAKSLSPSQKAYFAARRNIAAKGFDEVVTFSFMEEKKAKAFTNGELIALANPISSDLSVMRPSIIPNLLDAAVKNEQRGRFNQALFEAGFVFRKAADITQAQTITAILVGQNAEKNIYSNPRNYDVFDAKEAAFEVLQEYIVPESVKIKAEAPSYYHPGKSGAFVLGNKVIGYFGELHPKIIKLFDLKNNVAAFEIFTEEAPQPKEKKSTSKGKFEVSNLQAVKRDFAFLVDSKVTSDDLLAAVRKAEKNLVSKISIFDLYEGNKIEAGKKSIAFSVTLQPKDKTLTDEEIEAVSEKIVSSVINSTQASLRSA
jgi:phenylalanyl-tRNA synthetase beta chain